MMDTNTEDRKIRVEEYFRRAPDSKRRTWAIILISLSAVGGLLAIDAFVGGPGFLGFLFLAASGYGGYKGWRKMVDYMDECAAAEPKA